MFILIYFLVIIIERDREININELKKDVSKGL